MQNHRKTKNQKIEVCLRAMRFRSGIPIICKIKGFLQAKIPQAISRTFTKFTERDPALER